MSLKISTTAKKQLKELRRHLTMKNFQFALPKTQYSFTADPENGGLPQEHNLPSKRNKSINWSRIRCCYLW